MLTGPEPLETVDDAAHGGAPRGLPHDAADDATLDGRIVMVRGRRLVNFSSGSYLGLQTHPALRTAATVAALRYGTQLSSSRGYLSAPDYPAAEEALTTVFGRPTLVTPSATLGHLAALPMLVDERDALVLDQRVSQSVQTAAKLVRVQGGTVRLLPHSDLATLDRWIGQLASSRRRVWYAAGVLDSAYGDFAPIEEIDALMSRQPRLWLYLDDAHSVSWSGRHGRGHALELLSPANLARCVLAASLDTSFAAAGGALTFPDERTRRRVFTLGGPMIFAGPVRPPMLAVVLASARLHLSGAVDDRRAELRHLIRLFNGLAADRGLPLVAGSEAPVRCIGAGTPRVAENLAGRLAAAGYFVGGLVHPAVAADRTGVRITLSSQLSVEDLVGLVDAVDRELPRALAGEGPSGPALPRPRAAA